MEAEVIAFADMFDIAFTMAEELRSINSRSTVPVKLYTDNKSLFDVVSRGPRKSEKRLMTDISAAREGFKTHYISDIGFVHIADGLTKAMGQAALRQVLQQGYIKPKVEQWIVCQPPTYGSSVLTSRHV